jgi:hypothetical protein
MLTPHTPVTLVIILLLYYYYYYCCCTPCTLQNPRDALPNVVPHNEFMGQRHTKMSLSSSSITMAPSLLLYFAYPLHCAHLRTSIAFPRESLGPAPWRTSANLTMRRHCESIGSRSTVPRLLVFSLQGGSGGKKPNRRTIAYGKVSRTPQGRLHLHQQGYCYSTYSRASLVGLISGANAQAIVSFGEYVILHSSLPIISHAGLAQDVPVLLEISFLTPSLMHGSPHHRCPQIVQKTMSHSFMPFSCSPPLPRHTPSFNPSHTAPGTVNASAGNCA